MRSPVRFALLFLPLLLLTSHAQRGGDPIERIREAEIKADLLPSPATTCVDAKVARSTS